MVSTVSEMSREFNATSDTANSFSTYTMQSTEASRTNSQERILLQKRRMQHSSPRASNIRLAYQPSTRRPSRPYHPMTHPRCDEVTESVKQANRERVKALENELQVAQHKLNEVSTENRTLQKLLRRQEVTLKHYEGSETSLPHIMQAHDEDMRVIRALLKQEKRSTRELTRQLKCKDDELTPLRHEHAKLLQLARDRQLGERRQLSEQLERQGEVIKDHEEKILTLTRRLLLESKSHAHRLGVEAAKTRDAQHKLSLAVEENERLRRLADERRRHAENNAHRRLAGGPRLTGGDSQAGSGVSLAGSSFPGLAGVATHLKLDPDIPWHEISLPETDSICSSVSVRSKPAPNRRSSIGLSNVRQTLRRNIAHNTSFKPPLELPDISSNAAAESGVQSDGSVHSSDDQIPSYESDSSSEMRKTNGVDSEKVSPDEGLAVEMRRAEAGSSGSGYGMTITLIKSTSRDSSADGRNDKGKVMIVELDDEESQVALLDKLSREESSGGKGESSVEKVGSSSEKGESSENVGESSNQKGEFSDKIGESSEKVEELSDNKGEPCEGEEVEFDDDEVFSEFEERLKLEKERTIELKAKFDKCMEGDVGGEEASANQFAIDLERKEKLLAALKAIDRGSPVRAAGDTESGVMDAGRRRPSLFMHASRHNPGSGRSRRPADNGLDLASDLVSPFSMEPTDGRPPLITELFGRPDGSTSDRKPRRRGLTDFAASRTTMFDQPGRFSLGDGNNNNASAAGNRF